MTLEGARLLDKVVDSTGLVVNDESALISHWGGKNWQLVGTNALVQRSYFDLSGYGLKDLSVFFQSVEIQEPAHISGNDNFNTVVELITTEFVSDAEVANMSTAILNGCGFSTSTMSMEQVVYGRRRLFYQKSPATTPVIPFMHSMTTWGTCSATTADKLHITRIFTTSTVASISQLYDANFVVGIVVAKEAELPFLMRQKRSYELATQG